MNKIAHGTGRVLRALGIVALVVIPFVLAFLFLYKVIGTFTRREAPQIPQVMAGATPTIVASPTTLIGNATPIVLLVLPTPTVGKTETTPLPTSTTVQIKPTETTLAKVQPTVVSTIPTLVPSEPAPRPVPTLTSVPQPTAIPEPSVPRITWFSIGTGQVVKINRGGCVSGDIAMAWGQDQEFAPYNDDDVSTALFVCVSPDVEAGWAKAPYGASGVYGLSAEQLGDTIRAQGKFTKVIGLLFPGAVPIYEK